jgi:diadenosine tetraphosphate (Ap4A) HIT family hydrolase
MSFHTDYARWSRLADPQHCPVCTNAPMPGGMEDVVELPRSWLNAEPVECLKWACHLTAKQHVLELYELADHELLALMKELQLCSKALKHVTRAIKINIEIHGNSLPHLHVHLYPRTLDDPFPGKPIDYRRKRRLYAEGEFETFVAALRAEIARLQHQDGADSA